MPIALIIHGGAWNIPDEQVDAHVAGCRAALAQGWGVLAAGGSAIDACEAAVRLLEDDPTFDAGTGSVLTSAGVVELDAAIMDGSTLHYGAVANVRCLRNPITLARHVLVGPATFLAGEGAEQFAAAQGLPLCANSDLIVPRERLLWEHWKASQATPEGESHHKSEAQAVGGHDTVGAIALDQTGRLAVANSTGGTPFKHPGRIGDTPLIGCGLYADGRVGGAVCTGWGEAITRVALARRAVELLERGLPPQSAAEIAIRTLGRAVPGGNGGCIILNPQGRIGLAWNTRRMAYAYQSERTEAVWGC
ncbi:MAG: peptidase T [Candidatus Viridilinea halotolerans]|uniref:Peptidase T n=1 Tax=Candidatus Viridilinea halotolerans TaxID=2491704 RepID=A0A426U127_9CHLR|nr:MAG: peptidase T [Candidatus Viridilinea halotolerans]